MADRTFARVGSVAWREFRHTALTKSFLIGAVIIPIVMIGLMTLVPALMVSQLKPLEGELAVVDGTGRFTPAFESVVGDKALSGLSEEAMEKLEDLGVGAGAGPLGAEAARAAAAASSPEVAARTFTADADLEALKLEARDGKWIGVLVIPPSQLEPRTGEDSGRGEQLDLFVPTDLSPRNGGELRDLVRSAVIRARFQADGEDYDRVRSMMSRPPVEVVRLGQEGVESEDSELRMIVPFGFMMLLWIATFTAGNYLLTSTIEEKSNKVMEVVLSAVGPLELLWGKILGLALVSVVILFTYGGLAIAGLAAFAMADLISIELLLWCGLFFLIAYFTIAALMAAVGSAVNDLREAQSLMGPVMLVLIVPMLLWMPIGENPNGMLATVASLVPPVLPFAMVMRLGAATEPIPVWQLLLGAGIGIGSVITFVWAASRIFRVGVLMQGKAPTPLELLRWIRQA
jgi:ABC-2 type transport system permease protein